MRARSQRALASDPRGLGPGLSGLDSGRLREGLRVAPVERSVLHVDGVDEREDLLLAGVALVDEELHERRDVELQPVALLLQLVQPDSQGPRS